MNITGFGVDKEVLGKSLTVEETISLQSKMKVVREERTLGYSASCYK